MYLAVAVTVVTGLQYVAGAARGVRSPGTTPG